MTDSINISGDESNAIYVRMLSDAGISFEDTVVMDVGCANGHFVEYAQRELGVKEAWGVDHYPNIIRKGFEGGVLTDADKERILVAAFSKVLGRADLENHFDVVKITAVTSFASVFEMRRMLPSAHFLLRDTGALLLELPQVNLMGRAFQANGKTKAANKLNQSSQSSGAYEEARMGGVSLAHVYTQLANIFFEKTTVKTGFGGVQSIVAQSPRCNPPDLKDIVYNLGKAELSLKGRALEISREIG